MLRIEVFDPISQWEAKGILQALEILTSPSGLQRLRCRIGLESSSTPTGAEHGDGSAQRTIGPTSIPVEMMIDFVKVQAEAAHYSHIQRNQIADMIRHAASYLALNRSVTGGQEPLKPLSGELPVNSHGGYCEPTSSAAKSANTEKMPRSCWNALLLQAAELLVTMQVKLERPDEDYLRYAAIAALTKVRQLLDLLHK